MEAFLEYIMSNYTWFLGIAIMILLSIIGYFADKTNFGQGKNKEKKLESEKELILEQLKQNNEQTLQDLINEKQEVVPTNFNEDIKSVEQETVKEIIKEESKIDFEDNFKKFDDEFNELLPKKEIIDDELLEEIDNLSLDKTQKLKLTDIPDLDDLELPKIKSMPKEEDIWKF